MSFVPTRRSLLVGMALAPIESIPTLANHDIASPNVAAWDEALSRYEAARLADDRFYHERLAPVQESAPVCTAYGAYRVGTRRDGTPLFHRFTPAELTPPEGGNAWSKTKGWREARAALDKYEAEYAAFDARTGFVALSAESERLNEAFADAEEALLLTPAPHVAALCLKIGILTTADGRVTYDNPLVILMLRVDAERFA